MTLFVAFRDEAGRAHVLSKPACTVGSLSGLLKTVSDCPYHGWEYSGDGNAAVSHRRETRGPAKPKWTPNRRESTA